MSSPIASPTLRPAPSSQLGHWTLVVGVLAALYLTMRLSGLMALPIFNDEAIYLRWAQLIRGDSHGIAHYWVSLADPKPPLHFWLMALVFNWTGDPLVAARLISVAAGAVAIPLMFAIGGELDWLTKTPPLSSKRRGSAAPPPSGRELGLLGALFLIFCPFAAFYQRLAIADGLFLTESLAIVWLSLRWARLVAGRYSGSWRVAISLGMAIGVALLTRQGISYSLCAMPVVAYVLNLTPTVKAGRATSPGMIAPRTFWRATGQILLVAGIAAMLWAPFLFVDWTGRALSLKQNVEDDVHRLKPQLFTTKDLTREDYLAELKRRVFYQDKFTTSKDEEVSRLNITLRNFKSTFVPDTPPFSTQLPTNGWLFYYMTPALYLSGLLGVVYLALRRQWPLLLFLLAWIFFTLGPVIILLNTIYSRYVLAGVPPLLIAGAFLTADFVAYLFWQFEAKPAIAWIGTLLVLISLLAFGLRDLGIQSTHWWAQKLTVRDQYQYITGWPAGSATNLARLKISRLAEKGPVLLITGNDWGTPSDALWVYFSGAKNVRVFYTDKEVIGGGYPTVGPSATSPASANQLYLRNDKWLWPAYEFVSVTPPPETTVLYVTKKMWDATPSPVALARNNPRLKLLATFPGIAINGYSDDDGAVCLFELQR